MGRGFSELSELSFAVASASVEVPPLDLELVVTMMRWTV